MAVIRPDRVTDDRIRALTDVANSEFQALIDLAEAELAAARAALEEEPNEYSEKLLTRAVAAFETGVALVESGHPRGIQTDLEGRGRRSRDRGLKTGIAETGIVSSIIGRQQQRRGGRGSPPAFAVFLTSRGVPLDTLPSPVRTQM